LTKFGRLGAALVGMTLVAAACGGSGSDSAETAGSIDDNIKNEVQNQLGGTDTSEGDTATSGGDEGSEPATAHPTSIEDWEKLWEEERAAVVARIKENGWGLQEDGTITGPEGFMVDTKADCPADWSNTEGLSDDNIKVGNPTPLSGTLADAGNISKAMQMVFDHYADQDFFTDSEGKNRRVELLIKDDGYDPARTIPLVDEFMDSDRVFAISGLGSPNVMKTYDKINERCVPHPFVVTGHPAWGDPINHPWTSGILMAYNTEAVLWGSFIDQHIDEYPDGIKVASIIMNNDFGAAYDGGLKAYIAQSPNKDKITYVSEKIEPQAPNLTDPMTNLAAQKPDMFIAMVAGTPCTQAFVEAAQNGLKDDADYLFTASVCKPSTNTSQEAAGMAPDGWWIMGGGFRDINASEWDGNAYIEWGRQVIRDAGVDPKSSGNLGTGIAVGWNWSQSLKIAGELDGGLTRANFLVAYRAIDMTHGAYLDGIKFNANGNADAYYIEGSELAQRDQANEAWIVEGDIIELSGKSKNCAWDQALQDCT